MATSIDQRALGVLSSMKPQGRASLGFLYGFLENNGVFLANTLLGWQYGTVNILKGGSATKDGFLGAMATLQANPAIRAIDCILMVHGAMSSVYFENGSVPTAGLKGDLLTAG